MTVASNRPSAPVVVGNRRSSSSNSAMSNPEILYRVDNIDVEVNCKFSLPDCQMHFTKHFLLVKCDKKRFAFRIWYGIIYQISTITSLTTLQCFSILCYSFDFIRISTSHDADMRHLFIYLMMRKNRLMILNDFLNLETQSMQPKLQREIEKKVDNFDFNLEDAFSAMKIPQNKFKISKINKNYELIPSYPETLVIPKDVADSVLLNTISFRSDGRFPALTYYIEKNDTSLWRSSQPLAGLKSRCSEDEAYVDAIRQLNRDKKLAIIDLRPIINIIYNSATGKGSESTKNYQGCKYKSYPLENIHNVRRAFDDLYKSVYQQQFDAIDDNKWRSLIKNILKCSKDVSQLLQGDTNILIHCSDGWDRTSQVSSIVQIILSPECRTFTGFFSLICKDWICFGHKFLARCGRNIDSNNEFYINNIGQGEDESEFSPIFLLFMASVHQIIEQNRVAFEFTSDLLLRLHYEVFNNKFYTFIGNTEQQYIGNKFKYSDDNISRSRSRSKSFSLFDHLLLQKENYSNSEYQVQNEALTVDSKNLSMWENLINGSIILS